MDTQESSSRQYGARRWPKIVAFLIILLAVLGLAHGSAATAAPATAAASPFIGHWQAIDVDGSDIRLTIAGPPGGPFRITWTESYISFCDREAGIVRGTGWLSDGEAYLLEADLTVECFTTGSSLDFHLTFRYHPGTNMLSGKDESGIVTIWHRPGQPPPAPLALDLRVNYGHDWVESFYEAGHMVWITVTESDGVTVKATAEAMTEPRDEWGGEPGFQTRPEDWVPAPPDIQPYDWVFGWVDNGASAQVQIGDISGAVALAADSIVGTIYAPWFTNELEVDCHSWGAPLPEEILKYDTVLPDGEDTYSCSWAGEWDIQPYQDIGVGYTGPDGQWVANAITPPNPRIVASEAGDWFWVTEFYPGLLELFIYESTEEGAALLWSGQQEAVDLWGITSVGNDVHGLDLLPGNYLIVSDGVNEKGLVLESISMDVFDTENEIMAGTAPGGREILAVAGMAEDETQGRIAVIANLDSGAWLADFRTIGFDITEEMRPWSFAHIYDEDGDANEAGTPALPSNPHFVIFPEWEWFDGLDWPDGVTVTITVEGKQECQATQESWGGFFNGGFPESCDVVAGDVVNMTDGVTTRTHTVQNLTIANVDKDANTVSGTADAGALVDTGVHNWWGKTNLQLTAEDGTWLADYGAMGFDLVEDMCGRAHIFDELGNATAVDWCIPNPHFVIFPDWEWFDGLDWPDGMTVTITVEGKPECATEGVSSGNFFNGSFPEGCDIAVDDVVTFTDGAASRTHTVRNLAITTVDMAADTVAGTADAYAEVYVWPHATGEQLSVLADATGMWEVSFAGVFDLVSGECGRSEVRDMTGNGTAVDWCVP